MTTRAAAGDPLDRQPLVTIVHPAFGDVGGAEVLALRHAALLRDGGCAVRVLTRAFDAARWRAAADDVGAEVRVVAPGWWERQLRRMPARQVRAAVARLAPHARGSACVVATNAPAPAMVDALAAAQRPRARAVWACNEPSRDLHFPETTRHAVARLGHALGAVRAPDEPEALAWARERLAWYAHRLATVPRFAAARAVDLERAPRADVVVALSRYTAESVRLVYGRAVDAVIPPVVPPLACVPRRGGIDRSRGGLHVLAHARLGPLKNVDTVLRGFAQFRARVSGAHQLHVVGTGPSLDGLRGVGDALGLAGAVRWHGYLDAVALEDLYARCDVFALLPVDEPFGMVFPEAALRGLLLIGPDHGGPAEILDGGAYGWAVDAFDPEALADALAAAWALPDDEAVRRRERAAAACRARYGAASVGPQLRRALLD